MYEYNSDKILQRQRVCMKCASFVTHEKSNESAMSCPLCGHQLKPPKPRVAPIGVTAMSKEVRKFYEEKFKELEAKRKKKNP